jgi:hypothetical protein
MSESIVCTTYPDCDREHAGGLGGTPVHPPEGAVICPGNYDCPKPSGGTDEHK